MTDTTLIQRLRTAWTYCGVEQALRFEAADALEQQAAQIAEKDAEIARLTECLSKANANHEHFERAWYLRGDEIEALRVALNWYADEARACAKNSHACRHGAADALLASVTVLALDGGKRADAALRQEQPT